MSLPLALPPCASLLPLCLFAHFLSPACAVSEFDPPAAYWGVNKPPAGGGCKYEVPQGVIYEDAAFLGHDPEDPGEAGAIPPSEWEDFECDADGCGVIVHAFHHAYWCVRSNTTVEDKRGRQAKTKSTALALADVSILRIA